MALVVVVVAVVEVVVVVIPTAPVTHHFNDMRIELDDYWT